MTSQKKVIFNTIFTFQKLFNDIYVTFLLQKLLSQIGMNCLKLFERISDFVKFKNK